MEKDKIWQKGIQFDKVDNCKTLFNGKVKSHKAIIFLIFIIPYEMYILYTRMKCLWRKRSETKIGLLKIVGRFYKRQLWAET